jgi:phage-related protein
MSEVQDRLNQRFQGTAAAAVAADGGIQQMKNQMALTQDQIGTALLPVLDSLTKSLAPILQSVATFIQNHPQLAAALLGVVAIGGTLSGVGTMVSGVTGALKPIGGVLGTVGKAFNSLGGVISSAMDAVPSLLGTLGSAFQTVGGIIAGGFSSALEALPAIMDVCLGPIGLIILAVAALALGVYEVIKNWSTIQPFLMKLWDDVKKIFTDAIAGIGNSLKANWPLILAIITGPIGLMVYEIAKHWTQIIAGVTGFKDKISAGMGEIKTEIVKVWGDIENFFKSLPAKFLTWGTDMISGLITGIKNMVGKVGDAVKGVADKIKSYLHFSAPDEGPLADYQTWMPDMMTGLANGIKNSRGALQNALTGVASDIKVGLNATVPAMAGASAATSAPIINFTGPMYVRSDADATNVARQLGQLIQSAQFAGRGR